MKTKVKYYKVTQIRSQRANEREGYEHPYVEKAWDFETLEEAKVAYDMIFVGIETEKELFKVIVFTNGNEELESIETTY